jgi:hypothetical protein
MVQSLPVLPFVGGRAGGSVEGGRRWSPAATWSGYLGFGLDADVQVMASTRVPFSQLSSLGSIDNVGGLAAGSAIRIAGGASQLQGNHSLVVTTFVQSQLALPQLGESLLAFYGGGARVRWDIAHKLIAFLDVFIGVSPRTAFPALAFTQQTLREQVAASFRYVLLGGASWIGAQALFTQDNTTTAYTGSQSYLASAPPAMTVSVQYGLSFGGSR